MLKMNQLVFDPEPMNHRGSMKKLGYDIYGYSIHRICVTILNDPWWMILPSRSTRVRVSLGTLPQHLEIWSFPTTFGLLYFNHVPSLSQIRFNIWNCSSKFHGFRLTLSISMFIWIMIRMDFIWMTIIHVITRRSTVFQ